MIWVEQVFRDDANDRWFDIILPQKVQNNSMIHAFIIGSNIKPTHIAEVIAEFLAVSHREFYAPMPLDVRTPTAKVWLQLFIQDILYMF